MRSVAHTCCINGHEARRASLRRGYTSIKPPMTKVCDAHTTIESEESKRGAAKPVPGAPRFARTQLFRTGRLPCPRRPTTCGFTTLIGKPTTVVQRELRALLASHDKRTMLWGC
jgi:hypothetical protein